MIAYYYFLPLAGCDVFGCNGRHTHISMTSMHHPPALPIWIWRQRICGSRKVNNDNKERTDVKDFFLIDSSLIIPSATLSAVIRYSIATNEEVEIVSASSIRDIQLDVDFVAQWTETSSAEWTTAWNRLLLSSSRCFGSASSWRVAVSTEIFKTPSLPPLYYASERRGCRCRQ